MQTKKYGYEIPVKEYDSIRESVGWKVLEEEQAQKGLEGSEFLIAAYDGERRWLLRESLVTADTCILSLT